MNQKGFSLIEVVLSLAIISIIVVPFIQIFINSTYTNNLSKREIQASFLAQKYMEEAKAELNYFSLVDMEDVSERANGTMFKENNEQDFKIVTEYNDVTNTINKGNSSISDGSIIIKDSDFDIYTSIDEGEFTSFKLDHTEIPVIDSNTVSLKLSTDSDNEKQINMFLEAYSTFINTYKYEDKIVFMVSVDGKGNTDAKFSIYNKTGRKLILYEFDDNNNNLTFNVEEGEAEIVKNLSSNTSSEILNNQKLYKVTVTVYFKDKEYERIVSQIRN